MSTERADRSRPGEAPEPAADPSMPGTSFVRSWRQTPTLQALRELLSLSETVAPTIARRAGMSHSELRTLELLVREPYGPAELARELGVTTAASSGIIDRLVERGHVVRQAHSTDGRRTVVVMTESGREELLAHLLPMFRALGELDAELDDHERDIVERYLRGAMAAIRQVL